MFVAIAKPFSSGYSLMWMGNFREKISGFIYSIRQSKALSLAVILVLAAAIPLTVYIAQKQQDLRQRAATITEPKLTDQSEEDKQPLRTRGYIIELKNPSLVEQQKKLEKSGKKGASLQSETQSYKSTLEQEHQNAKKDMLSILGKGSASIQSADETLTVLNEYTTVLNGFALDITKEQADKIKGSAYIKNIYPNIAAYANLQDSVPLIKVNQVWQTTDSTGSPVKGKGQTIAIIDTGIDYSHADLGGTQVSDRPFTQIALQNNDLYDVDQSFSFNNNRIAYADGDKIKIYNIASQTTQSIEASASGNVFRILLRDNLLAYFASKQNLDTSLYVYDLNTNINKKITNTQVVEGIAITQGKIIYRRSTSTYNDTTGEYTAGEEGLFFYDVASETETAIEPLTDDNNFKVMYAPLASGNTVIYSLRNFDPNRNNNCLVKAVLYDLTTGTKKEIAPSSFGPILDFKENKFFYVGCYNGTNWDNYYLYDISTDQSQHISYTGRNAAVGTQSAIKNFRITSWRINKGSIGNGVVFFSPDVGDTNQIVAYDLTTERYVAINLYTNSSAIEAEDKTVCFSAEDKYIYCHTYDPSSSYALPTNIFNSKVVNGYDFVHNDTDPFDDHGHGTHVAGIAAGLAAANQTASILGGPTPIPPAPYLGGVAPEAKLVSYKVLNASGRGYWSNIIAAIEKAVDTRLDSDLNNNIDVINMSLGSDCVKYYGAYQSYCGPDDALSRAVDNAVDAGIVVVVAAGNSGRNPGESINSPGTARKAITVGAVDKSKKIADFSSRGPVTYNGEVIQKPDVVAPGVDICSAERGSWYSSSRCRDNTHIAINGTSMASPHVAGLAALLAQKHPDWAASQVKSAIINSAEDLGLASTIQGKGFINSLSALTNNPPTPTPTPPPPAITSIRPAWIKEEYKAQPWVNQGDKVAIKGSGFSPVASQNHVYVGGVLMPEQFNTVSSDGTQLIFVLTTETNFEIGNYYDVYVKNQNRQSNSIKMRIISPTVLFSAIPNPAPRDESIIILRGINFGQKQGSVFIYDASGGAGLGAKLSGAVTLGGYGGGVEIKSWKNNEIRIVLPKALRLAQQSKEYTVWVNGSYGGQFIYSSNRIKLRVK